MSLADTPPRGGLIETFDGTSYPLVLRMSEIEVFEDKHGGIFEMYDGLIGRRPSPRSAQVLDLLALGLVGGGATPAQADELVQKGLPATLPRLRLMAAALIGIAFHPDEAADEEGEEPDASEKTEGGK